VSEQARSAASIRIGRNPQPRGRLNRSGPLIESPGPSPDTPLDQVRLTIGIIIGTHGVGGELKVRIVTDRPDQFANLKTLYVGEEERPRKVESVRFHAGNALVRLRGISTPEQAAHFRNQSLRISGKDALPAEPGEFFLYQLIGLTAYDELGHEIGTVTDLMETGSRDVLVIRPPSGGQAILLPNSPEVVLEVKPQERRMTVRPLVYFD
jgi:16S rRNA processing protein RimM